MKTLLSPGFIKAASAALSDIREQIIKLLHEDCHVGPVTFRGDGLHVCIWSGYADWHSVNLEAKTAKSLLGKAKHVASFLKTQ